jgi:hypothetical protein
MLINDARKMPKEEMWIIINIINHYYQMLRWSRKPARAVVWCQRYLEWSYVLLELDGES